MQNKNYLYFTEVYRVRKSLLLIICFYFCFILVACNSGKVNNAEVTIEQSNKFSETEIKEAIHLVKTKFKDFRGCNLTKLWYDEEKSNEYVVPESENIIVLFSSFETDKSVISQGFNPNSTYDNWMWILTRESKSENWEIIGWGY
jgi:hypothetical protein